VRQLSRRKEYARDSWWALLLLLAAVVTLAAVSGGGELPDIGPPSFMWLN
jgi:hypothetical protein